MISKSEYFEELDRFAALLGQSAAGAFEKFARSVAIIGMNMSYERIAFSAQLPEHPFLLTREVVRKAAAAYETLMGAAFIGDAEVVLPGADYAGKEEKHKDLFNAIWDRYEKQAFEEYVARYERRIDVNGLAPLLEGKDCVDFGCGNGMFCFALLRRGARSAFGLDYGERSVAYAQNAARQLGLEGRARFEARTVYDTGLPDESFDFAVQNGVFHHLDDTARAIGEVRRVLRPGGYFWYYTAGAGAISRDLSDWSVAMMKDVPHAFLERVLGTMCVSRNKTAHLMDLLKAIYASTTWAAATALLAGQGFGDFRRLTGGMPTDYDLDRLEADPWGREKFGEGDLRILCRRL